MPQAVLNGIEDLGPPAHCGYLNETPATLATKISRLYHLSQLPRLRQLESLPACSTGGTASSRAVTTAPAPQLGLNCGLGPGDRTFRLALIFEGSGVYPSQKPGFSP